MMNDHVTILRTGKLYVFDMAVDVLKTAAIPHFTRQETVSGMNAALPASPSGGPGVWLTIAVHQNCENEARALLDTLPFPTGTHPDVWDYNNGTNPLPKAAQVIFSIVIFGALAWNVFRAIRSTL